MKWANDRIINESETCLDSEMSWQNQDYNGIYRSVSEIEFVGQSEYNNNMIRHVAVSDTHLYMYPYRIRIRYLFGELGEVSK
jgi:hypothetical protein